MTLRSRATEIPELVRRLGSRRRDRVDAARARLAIVGARAVEALIEALEDGNPRIRSHAMPLLALIQDPRGREPLTAMLLDRDPRTREIAARCLARFPSPVTHAALERFLAKETKPEPRIAAVHALLEHYASGEEQAIRRVLELVLDRDESPPVRVAALALLPQLRPSARRGIIRRLKDDPVKEIARRASELEDAADARPSDPSSAVRTTLCELGSADYAVWNEAVHALAALGPCVVDPLVRAMETRAHDPEYCTRAGMTLKALGPRRAKALGDAIDRVDAPIPLQVLVEVAGALGDKSLIYRLRDLIERIGQSGAYGSDANGFDAMQRVRAKAHLELARIGSRVAIEDLREALSDPDRRVELEVVAAVERIGARAEIPDLLRAYRREEGFLREKIADAVRAIMKRERIRRNSVFLRGLDVQRKRALEAILPPPSRRRRSRGRHT